MTTEHFHPLLSPRTRAQQRRSDQERYRAGLPSEWYDAREAESMATSTRSHATETDLLRMPNDGRKYELVDGQIRVSPAGGRHGLTIVELTARLLAFVKRKRSGYVFESSTGFRLAKGNVRSPDISFVGSGPVQEGGRPQRIHAVPIRSRGGGASPEDRSRFVLDKVGE
jgi:putative restriction endonuclease